MDRIFLSPPHMGGMEQELIREAFASNYVAPLGPMVTRLEEKLAAYSTMPHVLAVSAGTAAIHLGLLALGVKAGDNVICSSFTFCGSVNPICYIGAQPVFVDSERDTWNMDPVLLDEAIQDCVKAGKKPSCIVCVHLYGMPSRMDKIMAIADRYGIPVLEDAAEALGGSYKGTKMGAWGTVGIYSFNGNKIITSSGGGALLARTEEIRKYALFLATQARDPKPYYEHSTIGYNYRMSNIVAAIGCGQMDVLDKRVARRREINALYRQYLDGDNGISFQTAPDGDFFSNYWLTTVLLSPERFFAPEEIRQKFEQENIETRALWKPLHMQPVFKGCKMYGGAVCESLFEIGLCLPSGSAMTDEQVARISRLLLSYRKK